MRGLFYFASDLICQVEARAGGVLYEAGMEGVADVINLGRDAGLKALQVLGFVCRIAQGVHKKIRQIGLYVALGPDLGG